MGCSNNGGMNANGSRDLRITGVSRREGCWQYHIDVLDARSCRQLRSPSMESVGSNSYSEGNHEAMPPVVRYSVMRRYNDFRVLHEGLVMQYGVEKMQELPAFPEGGFLSYLRAHDTKLLQYRQHQLNKYIRAVDDNCDLHASTQFVEFLQPDATDRAADCLSLMSSASQPHSWHSMEKLDLASSDSGQNGGYVSLSYIKSPDISFTLPSKEAKSPVLNFLSQSGSHVSDDADESDSDDENDEVQGTRYRRELRKLFSFSSRQDSS